jgi:dihydropteroate synthase
MGILNLTPDSFSDAGLHPDIESAVTHGMRMEDEGADIIDVGGESTRPGAQPVSAAVETARVIPVISRLVRKVKVPVSIDTTKAEVAEEAIQCGARMVNDVSALSQDKRMAEVVAKNDVDVVLMHMRGNPRTMQDNPVYRDVVAEIKAELLQGVERARSAGTKDKRIIIDPGIGFGKTVEHNLEILGRLAEFKELGFPVMLGTSRKSFIGKVLGLDVGQRIFGTAATVAIAVLNGANIIRVHEVREMVQVTKMVEAILRGSPGMVS